MTEKRVQINKVVKDQLPSYVRDDSPLVGEFLSAYYQGQEYQGGPIDIINNLDSYIQLNKSGSIVGFTTLSSAVGQFDQTIFVKDTTGFPDNYGLLKIDDEIITYTGIGTTALQDVFVVLLVLHRLVIQMHQRSLYFQHLRQQLMQLV